MSYGFNAKKIVNYILVKLSTFIRNDEDWADDRVDMISDELLLAHFCVTFKYGELVYTNKNNKNQDF